MGFTTVTNAVGTRVRILDHAAAVQSLTVAGPDGPREVVLGYADPHEYLDDPYYLGAVVGRYANRIRDAAFALDGVIHTLDANDGRHTVHGGRHGLSTKSWGAAPIDEPTALGVRLTCHSPHGESGFPGNLRVRVDYRLDRHAPTLTVTYAARTDRPTVINLTNHTFFNLGGETILDHTLQVDAEHYLPLDEDLLPTGLVAPVDATALDLRHPRRLRSVIASDDPQICLADGLDHTFVLTGSGLRRACTLTSEDAQLSLHVLTTEPAIDVYAAGAFDGSSRGATGPLHRHRGIALETEHFSNSPNEPAFPSTVLLPVAAWNSTTRWALTAARTRENEPG